MLKSAKFKLVSGIIFLLGGAFYLLLDCISICITYFNNSLNLHNIIGSLILLIVSVACLSGGANCFIQYGMAKGVDYTLEKQSRK